MAEIVIPTPSDKEGVRTMDPTVEKLVSVGYAERHGLMMADIQLAQGRARDTALHGLKVIEGVVASELLVSNDPAEFARLNAGVAMPGTLQHYGAPAPSKSPA